MDPDKWRRIKEVFDSAVVLETGAQSEYVAKACQDDGEVLSEVQTLLRHHQEAASRFLNQTPLGADETASTTNAPRSSRAIGSRIGVYQIVKEIGHGGMGEVYRAARVDGTYEKEVAIKFVRGGFDTASVVERFRNERQILASLDHPNIARLLDGGTTDDGVPYLVMELIEGTPIDEYCDQRALAITPRLELFRQVCGAVQYAHQHLVIHRDIKPGNILVGDDGTPKLLDFGIAKILDPAAGSEPTQFRPMTPEYASPEQVRGAPITTATDIYSLGVVLYQLLTGRSPYVLKTRDSHELAQAICERDPQKPSSRIIGRQPVSKSVIDSPKSEPRDNTAAKLKRRLSGDLDNILLMALRKEPEKRYAFVAQFSDDIRRNIEGLPVLATRGSWSYRTRKFVLRNKGAVAAVAVVLVSLALGLILTLREKRIAERRFNDVRALANSLIFEIDDSIRDLPGATSARKLLVSRALQYLDRLSGEASGDPSLQRELATAYERVGDVLGHPYAANLGDTPGALASYRKALAIRESLAAASMRDDAKLQNEIVGNYFRIANVLEVTSDRTGALDAFQRALPIAQQLKQNSPNPAFADQLAGVHYFIAQLLARGGDHDHALANYEQARNIRSEALDRDPQNISLRSHLAADYIGIAKSIELNRRHEDAIAMEAKAVEILQQLSRDNPNSASLREYYAESLSQIAGLYEAKGDHEQAVTSARQSHEMFGNLLKADPKDHLARTNFAFTDLNMGVPLLHLKKNEEALEDFREAVKTFEEMSPEKSGDRYLRSGLAQAYLDVGNALLAMAQTGANSWDTRRVIEARTWYDKSAHVWEQKQKMAEIENDESGELNLVLTARSHCDEILTVKSVSRH